MIARNGHPMPSGNRSQRGRAKVVVVSVVVLVVVVAAAAFWLTRPRYVDPTRAIPENATALFTLDLESAVRRGTKLHEVWELAKKKSFAKVMTDQVDGAVKEYGEEFDARRDLFDWCGDQIAMASFPLGKDERGAALLVTVRDLGKARQTLAKVRRALAKDKSTFRESRHRGITISAGKLGFAPVACAIVGRLVVFAHNARGVQAVIDAIKSGKSLARVKDFREAMDSTPESAFARAYWTGPEWDMPNSAGDDLGQRILRGFFAFRGDRFRGTVASFSAEEHGLSIRATSLYKSGVKPLSVPACSGQVVGHFPESTAAVVVFGSLQALWEQLRALPKQVLLPFVESDPDAAIAALEKTVEDFTGYRLEQDWLAWMDGECGIALTRPQARPYPSAALILGTGKPDKMKQTVNGLMMRAALLGLMTTTPEIEHSDWIDSTIAINVPEPGSMKGLSPVLATAKDAAVLVTGSDVLSGLLPLSGQKSLTENATYKRARAALPDRPAGFLYVDMRRAFETAQQAVGDDQFTQVMLQSTADQLHGLESIALALEPQPHGQDVFLWLGIDWADLFTRLRPPEE